jgi:hypothetical protein
MNSTRDAALEFVNGLSASSSEREFRFTCLVTQTRISKRAWDIIREIYRLAATGEWQPGHGDLTTLVYAPLDNPALIAHIESDMDRILSRCPAQSQLRSGWRYVQCFSCNPFLHQPEVVACSD